MVWVNKSWKNLVQTCSHIKEFERKRVFVCINNQVANGNFHYRFDGTENVVGSLLLFQGRMCIRRLWYKKHLHFYLKYQGSFI